MYIIAACCILHNICILHDCPAPPADAELRSLLAKYAEKYPSNGALSMEHLAGTAASSTAAASSSTNGFHAAQTAVAASNSGVAIRNAIVKHLKHVYQV